MADWYFAPELNSGAVDYLLEGDEAHHISRVCRAEVGDETVLFNGKGLTARARIAHVAKRDVLLTIKAQTKLLPNFGLTLIGCPLPKGDRATTLIEKCTELGVAQFVPISTKRSVVNPREAKLEKLRRTMIEACKQSHRPFLMEVVEPMNLEQFLEQPVEGTRLILDPRAQVSLSQSPGQIVAVAIGPEGGWDDSELAKAHELGWESAIIPGNVLRMETAVIAAAAWARIHTNL